MKILLVNTFDRGGAANSCIRLHQGLRKLGVNSKVLLRFKTSHLDNCFSFSPLPNRKSFSQKVMDKVKAVGLKFSSKRKDLRDRESDFLKNRPAGLEMFSFPGTGLDITQSPLYKEAEVINLHWVANFVDYDIFFKKNTKPVVWTLHDMNPFTGGEHYTESVLGMDENGNPIPRTLSKEEREIEAENLEIKRKALREIKDLTIVAPSKWMAMEARKSDLFHGRPVHEIPNGLDSKIFTARDKNFSREILGIPQGKEVLLFVADSLSNNRKGFNFLQEALRKLESKNLLICAIGNKYEPFEAFDNVIELGAINDERLMSMAYSAADAFVIPSLMDNLPNTVLESLMCGTPVIGFPVGGIPDMVKDGFNGLLTKEISVSSLVESIERFLQVAESFDTALIRRDAVMKFDSNIQAKKYRDLFNTILENKVEN